MSRANVMQALYQARICNRKSQVRHVASRLNQKANRMCAVVSFCEMSRKHVSQLMFLCKFYVPTFFGLGSLSCVICSQLKVEWPS